MAIAASPGNSPVSQRASGKGPEDGRRKESGQGEKANRQGPLGRIPNQRHGPPGGSERRHSSAPRETRERNNGSDVSSGGTGETTKRARVRDQGNKYTAVDKTADT